MLVYNVIIEGSVLSEVNVSGSASQCISVIVRRVIWYYQVSGYSAREHDTYNNILGSFNYIKISDTL